MEKIYYLVNPKGIIHAVDRAHAEWRLRNFPGYHLATKGEIARYNEMSGNQDLQHRAGMTAAEWEAYQAQNRKPNKVAHE